MMKNNRLFAAIVLLLAWCPVSMYGQSAKIEKFWVDLDAIKDGEQGLMGHLKFDE